MATTTLTIAADLTLVYLTVEEVVANGVLGALKNIVVEPAITLTVAVYVLLIFDWWTRYSNPKTKTNLALKPEAEIIKP